MSGKIILRIVPNVLRTRLPAQQRPSRALKFHSLIFIPRCNVICLLRTFGNINGFKVDAIFKYVTLSIWWVFTHHFHICQTRASSETKVSNACHRIGDNYGGQTRAPPESFPPYARDGIRNYNGR